MKCPDECQCFHDQLWSANVVQCSKKNLSNVPSLGERIFFRKKNKNYLDICHLLILVPMDVTALHLAENNLTSLSQSMFLGRSRLKQIFIRHSNIHDIENATFSGLDHLELIGKISNLFILQKKNSSK